MNTKKLLCFTAAFLLINTWCTAQSTVGLVAHWQFNGNVNDNTANAHNGTANSITYSAGRTGAANKAAVFNGSSSYISVPYQSDLNMTSFSICATVKPTGYYTGNCQTNGILWRGTQGNSGAYAMYFYDNPYDGNCSVSDTSRNVFAGHCGNVVGVEAQWKYLPAVVTNTWYSVVLTYKTDTFRVYVDGLQKASFYAASGSIGSSTEGLNIGANFLQSTGYDYWFKGSIDDIRLYNRVLPQSEINEYYNEVYISKPVSSTLCKTVPFNVDYTTIGSFNAGNAFNVELSDASGSFASPQVIGTTTTTTSGSVSCIVPASVALGSGYKIRLVSTSPVKITDVINVSVNLPATAPTVSISVAPSVYVPNGSTIFYSAIPGNAGTTPTYQWRRNEIDIPGANGFTYSAKAGTDFVSGDSISCRIRSSITCATPDTAISNRITMTIFNSIETVNNADFAVYPNPNTGSFTLKGKMLTDKASIKITDALGRVVYTDNINTVTGTLQTTININNAANGLYYLQLQTDAGSETMKIQIER